MYKLPSLLGRHVTYMQACCPYHNKSRTLPSAHPNRKVALLPIFLFISFMMVDITNPARNITSGIVAM